MAVPPCQWKPLASGSQGPRDSDSQTQWQPDPRPTVPQTRAVPWGTRDRLPGCRANGVRPVSHRGFWGIQPRLTTGHLRSPGRACRAASCCVRGADSRSSTGRPKTLVLSGFAFCGKAGAGCPVSGGGWAPGLRGVERQEGLIAWAPGPRSWLARLSPETPLTALLPSGRLRRPARLYSRTLRELGLRGSLTWHLLRELFGARLSELWASESPPAAVTPQLRGWGWSAGSSAGGTGFCLRLRAAAAAPFPAGALAGGSVLFLLTLRPAARGT